MSGLVSDLRFQAIPRVRFLAQNSATEDELDQLLAPLQSFVSVFAGKDLEIGEGQLILNDGTSILRLHGWRTVLGPDRTRPWLAIGNLHPLSETFKRWYALSLRLPTGMAMLTEYLRVGPAAPTEDQLLYLARFIEQYHRLEHESLRLPKPEFRRRRKAVQEALDGELADWVDGLVAGGNERRLAERLQELVEEHTVALDGVLGPNPEMFAQNVADTRNYYTHYSTYLKAKAATERDLVVLISRLWFLVRACLLAELRFPSEAARDLLGFDHQRGWLSRRP